jgi:hypothetical protein
VFQRISKDKDGRFLVPEPPVFYETMHNLLMRTVSAYSDLWDRTLEEKLTALAAERAEESDDEEAPSSSSASSSSSSSSSSLSCSSSVASSSSSS